MSENPEITVIVLNWNGRAYLEDCLSSLQRQTFGDFEVIVVDNGSKDDSVDFINEHYKGFVRLIELPENRGFAGGNNVGIRAAKGRYVALLNNDTEVHPEWLAHLLQCMESDQGIGMVGSKVLNFYQRDEIDNTGHLMYPDGLNRGRGRLEKDLGQYDDKIDILFPSGCAALYKKEMLQEIGGFDESFFAYGDDADIGLHGRFMGYKAVYCPEAVVYHKYSGTVGPYSPMKAFYVERNRIWILIKYFPLSRVLLSPFFTVLRFTFQVYGILTGRGAANRFARTISPSRIIRTVLSSYASAMKSALPMLRKRKIIRKRKRISFHELKGLLSAHRISCRELSLKD